MDIGIAGAAGVAAAAPVAAVAASCREACDPAAAGETNPPLTPASVQGCDSTMANALARLIEQQMQTQYEEHRKKMEALQARMESELLEKQATLFKALQSGTPFGTSSPFFVGSASRNGVSGSCAYLLSGTCAPGGHEASAPPPQRQWRRARAGRRARSCEADGGELSSSICGTTTAPTGTALPVTSDADGESSASSGTDHRFRMTAAAGEPETLPHSSSTNAGQRVNLDPCSHAGTGSSRDRDWTARPVALLSIATGGYGRDGDGNGGEAMAAGAGRLGASTTTASSAVSAQQHLQHQSPDELQSCTMSPIFVLDRGSCAAQHDGGGSSSSSNDSGEGELLSQSIHLPVPAAAVVAAESASALSDGIAKPGTARNWLDRIAHPDGGPLAFSLTLATTANAAAVAAPLPNGFDEVARPVQSEAPGGHASHAMVCTASGSSGRWSDGSGLELLSSRRVGSASSTRPSAQAALTSQSSRTEDFRAADSSFGGAMLDAKDGCCMTAAKPAAEAPPQLPPPLTMSDLSALRTPDEEDDLSTSLRLSLRQKHARQLANLRCYYEEEIDNLRCHMSSHEFLMTQEPYKKLLAENERLQQRTCLLDEELARAYRYITSVDKQMSALENTVKLITAESKQSSSEENKELAKLRLRHTTLQKDYDGLAGSHSSVQRALKSSQEALQALWKEQELLRVSLAQLRAEKQLLRDESKSLRLELRRSLQSDGGASREPTEQADHGNASASSQHRRHSSSSSTDLQSSPASAGESGARHVVGAAAVHSSSGGVRHQLASTGGVVPASATEACSASFASPSKEAWPWNADREATSLPFGSFTASLSMANFMPNSAFSDSSDKESRSEPVQTRSQDADHPDHSSQRLQQSADFSPASRRRAAVQASVSGLIKPGSAYAVPGFGALALPTDRGVRGTAVGGNADDKEDQQQHALPMGTAAAGAGSQPRGLEHLVTAAATGAAEPRRPLGSASAVQHEGATPTERAITGMQGQQSQKQQQLSAALSQPPQQPAALLQAYSPIASSPPGSQRCGTSGEATDAASFGSHMRPGCRRPSGGERRSNRGAGSSMGSAAAGSSSSSGGSAASFESLLPALQQQQQQQRWLYRSHDVTTNAAASDAAAAIAGSVASSAATSSATVSGDSTALLPFGGERLFFTMVGTQHGKKSPGGSEKKAKATQTATSSAAAADARKQLQRKSPTRRSLHASFDASGSGVQPLPGNHRQSSSVDSASPAASSERVNGWVDSAAERSRLGAATSGSPEVRAAPTPGGAAAVASSASLSERLRLMHDLELRLDELLSEKRELEAVLSRMPVTGGGLQDRLHKEEVEQQLDSVDRNLGSVRIALRRYKAL